MGEPRAAPARPMLARASGDEACGSVGLRFRARASQPLRPDARLSAHCALDACAIRRTDGFDSDPAGAWGRSSHIKKVSGRVGGSAARSACSSGARADRPTPKYPWSACASARRAPSSSRRSRHPLRLRIGGGPAALRGGAARPGRVRCRSGGGVGAQPPHQETIRAGGWGAARSARSSDMRAGSGHRGASRLREPHQAPRGAFASALHAGQQETVRGRVVRQRTTAGRRHLRARLPRRVGGLAARGDAHLAIFA